MIVKINRGFMPLWALVLLISGASSVIAQEADIAENENQFRFCLVTHRESHSLERSEDIEEYLTDGAKKIINGLNSYSFFQYNGTKLVPIGALDSILKPNQLCLSTAQPKMTLVVQEHVVRVMELGDTSLMSEPQIVPSGLRTKFYAGKIDDIRLTEEFYSTYGARANFEKIGRPAKITLKLAPEGVTAILAERIPSTRGRRITTKLTPFLLEMGEECGVEKRVFVDASNDTDSQQEKLNLLNVLKDCEMMELVSRANYSPMSTEAPPSKRIENSLHKLWKKVSD